MNKTKNTQNLNCVDKRRVSEIDLSQPRHETAFWSRHNGQVTSQLTNPIKWPNYPLELIGIFVRINTHGKESLTQRCRRSTNVQLCVIFCTYPYGLSLDGWHALLCIANNRHACNQVPLPYLDDETLMFLKIHLYLCLWANETKYPQHHDCGKSIYATHGG